MSNRRMLQAGARTMAMAVLAFATARCGFLNGARTETLSREFELHVQKTPAFMQCLEQPGGVCPGSETGRFFSRDSFQGTIAPLDTTMKSPASDARLDPEKDSALIATSAVADLGRDVLNHPVQKQLNALFDIARGVPPRAFGKEVLRHSADEEAVTITFSAEEFEDYERVIEAATLAGSWDALEKEASLFRLSAETARRSAYLKSYFEAYFRQGKFFKATLKTSELRDKLVAKSKEMLPGLSEKEYETLASRLFSSFGADSESQYVFGAIQDDGFVTRGGQAVRFPAVELSVTLGDPRPTITEVDYVAVGADLIRVLLHAVFDAQMRLPAVSNATGAALGGGLEVNDGTVVDEMEFERIEMLAGQIEGVVAAGTGRLLRGASFFSLNNEALASAIETAVGVALRKQAEKAVWCWYACKFNESHRDAGDFAAIGFGDRLSLTIEIKGTRERVHGAVAD